ncbi:MAG: hypothetical protein ACI4S2_09985 [Lachnospiraceae bacterium]
MKYYKYMYIQEGLEKKKEKIIYKLENGKPQFEIHLIILSVSGNNHLEIINSNLLLQKNYPQEDYFVVGITKGYDEALEMVEEIVREVYNETKGADIRSYILNKEQEG